MLFLIAFVIASLILLKVFLRRCRRSLKRTVLTFAVLAFLIVATIFGGPLSSGALFLLLPAPAQARAHEFPRGYQPLHKGHVDLPTGLYVREDEDLVLSESPWFVWRRAYLSNDRIARRMGIGTTHNAEWYLSGDPNTVQRISLIKEDGTQILFDRTSRGTSYVNAMFVHTHSDTEFYGARLGWTGRKWALRFESGALAIFQACGPDPRESCSLLSLRGPDGSVVQFKRDERRMLRAIDAGTQRITFEYDDQRRVIRASDGRHTASYSYDHAGRLVRAVVDGTTRSYSYGSRDEMLLIQEPGRSIENTYDDDLRLARQVVRYPGHADYVQLFSYVVEGDKVRETTMTENDGSRTVYRWNDEGRSELEIYESEGHSPVMVQFARAADGFTRSITVFCSNDGRRVTGTADVVDGDEDRAEAELARRLCN
jgi:YD repeat-containing protein